MGDAAVSDGGIDTGDGLGAGDTADGSAATAGSVGGDSAGGVLLTGAGGEACGMAVPIGAGELAELGSKAASGSTTGSAVGGFEGVGSLMIPKEASSSDFATGSLRIRCAD